MIFDADCHITPTHYTEEQLLGEMEQTRTERALIWMNPHIGEPDELNPYIYKACLKHPDRFSGFGWANPRLGVNRAIEQVKRCLEEYRFPGVKLNGAQNNYYIDDPALSFPVIDAIARRNGILALHVGADAIEHTHPFRVGKIAQRWPSLKILMVHMGGAALPDISDAAIEIAACHDNITIIASAIGPKPILKAIKTLSAARVCYGSDSPFGIMRVEQSKMLSLLEGEVTRTELAQIMYGNINALLKS